MKRAKIATLLTSLGLLALVIPAFAATTSVISGKVTGKSTNELMVKVGIYTYTVSESSITKYWDNSNKPLAATKIMVGDHVWVWGVKNTTLWTMTSVSKIKDLSVNTTTITGNVTSMATDKLMVKVGSPTFTATYNAKTKFWNKKGTAITVSTIKDGDKIEVWGQKDSLGLTVINIKQVKDLSR